MSYLIDTNVISELRKGDRADPNVVSWYADVTDGEVYLSALTLGELRQSVERVRRKDTKAAAALESWLGRVADQHGSRVLPVDWPIAEEWGRMGVPDPLPVIDGLLAATAKVLGLTLVTRNTADVERTGVSCVNPFLAPSGD